MPKMPNFATSEMARSRSILNTFKHRLARREVYGSYAKDFCLMTYLLLYRISLELGISILTPAEAVVVSILYLVIAFSVVNQGTRLLLTVLKSAYCLAVDMAWIYMNLDRIRSIMEHSNAGR